MKKFLLFLLLLIPINIKACYTSVSIPSGNSNRVNGHQGTCRAVIGASYNGTSEGSCWSGSCGNSNIAALGDLGGKLCFYANGFGVTSCTATISGHCMCDGQSRSFSISISLAEWGFSSIKIEGHSFDKTFKDATYDYNLTIDGEDKLTLVLTLNDALSKVKVTGASNLSLDLIEQDGRTYKYSVSGFNVGENKINIVPIDRNGNSSKAYVVHVIQKKVVPKTLQSIKFLKENLTLGRGEEFKLGYELYPADLETVPTLKWSSSNSSVASVSNGVIRGVSSGTAIITAEHENVKATITVNVKNSVSSIKFYRDYATVRTNETIKLDYTFFPFDATNKNVSFSSSNNSVAVVDDDGKVKGLKAGTTVITVESEDGKQTSSCNVTVLKSVDQILTSVNTLELDIYESVPVIATIYPKDASIQDVTWFSYNDNIAIVSNDGVITGLQEGETNVVAKVDGKFSDEITVVVKTPQSAKTNNQNTTLYIVLIIVAIVGVGAAGYIFLKKYKKNEI